MPRTSKSEKISVPETEKISAHIAITSEKSKGHADNEDSTLTDAEKELSGLFDGMGGGLAGKQASELAAKISSEELARVPEGADTKKWEAAIKSAMEKAQEEVIKLGNRLFFEQLDDPFSEATYKDQSQDKIQESHVQLENHIKLSSSAQTEIQKIHSLLGQGNATQGLESKTVSESK